MSVGAKVDLLHGRWFGGGFCFAFGLDSLHGCLLSGLRLGFFLGSQFGLFSTAKTIYLNLLVYSKNCNTSYPSNTCQINFEKKNQNFSTLRKPQKPPTCRNATRRRRHFVPSASSTTWTYATRTTTNIPRSCSRYGTWPCSEKPYTTKLWN